MSQEKNKSSHVLGRNKMDCLEESFVDLTVSLKPPKKMGIMKMKGYEIHQDSCQKLSDLNPCSKTGKEDSDWGDNLPEDIANLIMRRLLFADQSNCRALCNRWRSFPLKQLPWIFDFNHENMRLIDSFYKKSYIVGENSLLLKGYSFPARIGVLDSKQGWLLVIFFEFTLYNPFTRETIKIPWDFGTMRFPSCATFTCPPTSSDCMVIVITHRLKHNTIYISTCKPTIDKSWTTTSFQFDNQFKFKNIIFLEGVIYLLCNEHRIVASLDISNISKGKKAWTMIAFPPALQSGNLGFYMAESHGEILLVSRMFRKTTIDGLFTKDWLAEYYRQICVFKLVDPLTWVRIDTLGSRALYLTCWYSFSIEVSEEASTMGAIQADGIYFVNPPHLRFHSLKNDGRSYSSNIHPLEHSSENPGTQDKETGDILGFVEPRRL